MQVSSAPSGPARRRVTGAEYPTSLPAPAAGPHHEHAASQQQDRPDRAEQQRLAEGLTHPGLVPVQRADDLQHPAHVPLLPVPARRLGVAVVALDAGALHDACLGVTDDALAVDLGELVDRLLSPAQAQPPQRLALEVVPGSAVGPPGERVVAVLTHLDAGLARLVQLLADSVPERRRDAQ